MKSILIVAAVLLGLLAVMASAHKHGPHHGDKHGPHHGDKHGPHHGDKHNADQQPACHYKNAKGHTFDLSRLSAKDLMVKDMLGGSTYHFNPCGSVHASQCPPGVAVCEITSKGEAISYGLASNAHWADGVESGATLEIIYGGGELCPEGEHRKTVVEMRCLPSANPDTAPSFLMGVIKEKCLLKLLVESPLACDMEALCATLVNEATCNANSDLCEWQAGHCVASHESHHMLDSRKRIVTIAISAIIGFSAVMFLCCSLTCACIACRRAVQRRKLRRSLPTYKKAKKVNKDAPAEELNLITPETVSVPEAQHYPFQAYTMQQAADGSLVPVPIPMPMHMQIQSGIPPHAYSFPMVMPAYWPQQQHPEAPAQQ